MSGPTPGALRDYARLGAVLRTPPSAGGAGASMQRFADAAWDVLAPTGVSWIGFYTASPAGDCMVLGPRRDKPACSPIGLHGVCGRCLALRRPIVVRDVATLGAGYVACDPRDRSEVVVPLLEADGACRAVLDLDSHRIGAFSEHDAAELARALEVAGLSVRISPMPTVLHL